MFNHRRVLLLISQLCSGCGGGTKRTAPKSGRRRNLAPEGRQSSGFSLFSSPLSNIAVLNFSLKEDHVQVNVVDKKKGKTKKGLNNRTIKTLTKWHSFLVLRLPPRETYIVFRLPQGPLRGGGGHGRAGTAAQAARALHVPPRQIGE